MNPCKKSLKFTKEIPTKVGSQLDSKLLISFFFFEVMDDFESFSFSSPCSSPQAVITNENTNVEIQKEAPIIQTIINKMWFCNKDDEGVIHPEFSEGGVLAISTIVLALTMVTMYDIYKGYILLTMLPTRPKIIWMNG